MPTSDSPFNFAELLGLRDRIGELPPLEPYQARDGSSQVFRRYPATTDTHLILMHGSSGHSALMHAFAAYLGRRQAAAVYVPDLRGHGANPQRRGDIDYIDQLTDDLADLIAHIGKNAGEGARIVVGGFSSGGGLAVRFGASKHGHLAHAILLVAPYLGHQASTSKSSAGGWARADIPKIVGLSVLNGFGINALNGTQVLRFNLPEQYRSGLETLGYSYRMMKGLHPDDYRSALQRCKRPMLLLVGSEDEALYARAFKEGIAPYKPDIVLRHVAGGSHLGMLVSEPAMDEAVRWLKSLAF